MIQVVLEKPKKIVIKEVEKPRPGPGEVLIKVRRIGICGSDIHAYYGKHPFIDYPIVQGHEFSGEIAEIGQGVSDFKVGDKVTVMPQLTCGKCYQCLHGDYHICDNLKVIGCQVDGAAQEYISVPAKLTVKLPQGFDFDFGAVIEPLAVGVHAARKLSYVENKKLLVLGAGPIGNLTSQVLKAMGADFVMITDIYDFRLNIAQKCGADYIVNVKKQDLEMEIKEKFGEAKADSIIECVGSGDTINQAISLARKGSEIIVVGVFGNKPVVNFSLVQDRELKIQGSLMYKKIDYDIAIDLIHSKKVKLEPLITAHFSLKEYAEAYRFIENNKERTMKVLIDV